MNQEEQKIKAVKTELQKIKNKFAKSMGFTPREVIYAPFDRDARREELIDYMTKNIIL